MYLASGHNLGHCSLEDQKTYQQKFSQCEWLLISYVN